MNPTVVKQSNDIALRGVVDTLATTLVDSLASLVTLPLTISPAGEANCVDTDEWLESITSSRVVVRGLLDRPHDGHHLHIVFDLVDAITLSGQMMLKSDDVVDEDRNSLTFGREHHDAFAEIGNIACSGINAVLRRAFGATEGLRFRDFSTIQPGSDPANILDGGTALACEFNLRIGNYHETEVVVLIDHEVAQAWKGDSPLFVFGEHFISTTGEPTPVVRTNAEGPRRTTLSTFVMNPELVEALQQCGKALDLRIQHHAQTDIPNPAAHRDEIVVIEIPVGAEKRFEWARRLKQYHHDLPLVLLIHETSRPRVVQGLLTRANVILAWPSAESQLLAKLDLLTGARPPEDESRVPT